MDNSVKLVDNKGKTVASCRKERFGPGKMAKEIMSPSRTPLLHSFKKSWLKRVMPPPGANPLLQCVWLKVNRYGWMGKLLP